MCDTCYTIIGSKEVIDRLEEIAKKAYVSESNSIGKGWIGYIAQDLNDGKVPSGISMRGWINSEPERQSDNQLTIQFESAYDEQPDFRHFLASHLEDADVYYTAEEPGCDYFRTNISELETIIVDWSHNDDYEYSKCENAAAAVALVNEKFGKEFDTLEEVMSFADLYDNEDGDFLYVHEFEYFE